MKFAVYGVSRSGKNFFIRKLQNTFSKHGMELYHIPGSETLNRFALEKYGIRFAQCDASQKDTLRKQFISHVKRMEKSHAYVVVDGHYAFYDAYGVLRTICTVADIACYDKFFYLDSAPQEIIRRMQSSQGDKHNDSMTQEQIRNWQNYEIENFSASLLQADKELHILSPECTTIVQYVFECVTTNTFDARAIAQSMVQSIHLDSPCIILTDCDKTLSCEDSSLLAFAYRNQSADDLKNIFRNDRYSAFQLWRAHHLTQDVEIYTDAAIEHVVHALTPNSKVIDALRATGIPVVGITASNGNIWRKTVEKFGLSIPVLSHKQSQVSAAVKYFVVKKLQARGKFVIALGDSLLDGDMLRQANKGYLVVEKGYRDRLAKFLTQNPTVRQLDDAASVYHTASYEKKVSTIRTLPIDADTQKLISVCKSDSQKCGKILRQAHYRLGKKVASMIQNDFPHDTFAVISMLRSGVPFSFGIADALDCAVLFYDNDNFASFEKQLQNNPQLDNATFILCDAVVNSGDTVQKLLHDLQDKKCVIATNVLSDVAHTTFIPLYATRLSSHSFIGTKQKNISDGKGPDTSDRLYALL